MEFPLVISRRFHRPSRAGESQKHPASITSKSESTLANFRLKPGEIQKTGDDSPASSLLAHVWRMSGRNQIWICLLALAVAPLSVLAIGVISSFAEKPPSEWSSHSFPDPTGLPARSGS